MKVNIEDLTPVKKKINVEVPALMVDEEIGQMTKAFKNEAQIEGFRKGKVPENVVKQRFGDKINQEVKQRLVEQTFLKALEENDLKPVSKPDMEFSSVKPGQDFRYSAIIDVRPKIDLKGYKDIKIDRKAVEVSDADINEQIEHIRDRHARYEDKDSAVIETDRVTVDISSFVDGAPYEKDGQAKEYSFIIGQGSFFPEFEEAVVGAKIGEIKEFVKPFPQHYHDAKVAGKEVLFKLIVKNIQGKVLRDVDDEFASELGCSNVAELKERVKEEIKRAKEHGETDRVKKEFMDKLLSTHEFDVPESMSNRYYAQIMNNILDGVRRGVVNPQDMTLNSEAMKAKYFDMAIKQAKGDLILDAIADKENVEVTEDELNKTISEIAAARKETPAAIRERLESEGVVGMFLDGLRREKTFELIITK